MIKLKNFFTVSIVVVTLYIGCISSTSLTKDQKVKLSSYFTNKGISCLTNYTGTFDDVKALQAFEMPLAENTFCFFACILKKTDMMTQDGVMSPEGVVAVAKDVFEEKEELDNVLIVFNACAHVNDVQVTDMAEGCERAKLVLSCVIEQNNKN